MHHRSTRATGIRKSLHSLSSDALARALDLAAEDNKKTNDNHMGTRHGKELWTKDLHCSGRGHSHTGSGRCSSTTVVYKLQVQNTREETTAVCISDAPIVGVTDKTTPYGRGRR